MKLRNLLLLLTTAALPIHNSAMQGSKLLKQITVIPFLCGYMPIESPTYITDTIYFTGYADLGSGSIRPEITALIVNEHTIELNIDNKPIIGDYTPKEKHRHPIIKSMQINDDIFLSYLVEEQNNLSTTPAYPYILRNFKLSFRLDEDHSKPFLEELSYDPFKKNSHHSQNKQSCIFEYRPLSKPDYISQFFDQNGNLHVIKEEKLAIPILNLFIGDMATFLIRYHDIQVTEGKTMLSSPIVTWKNSLRMINGAFLLFIAYLVFNKIAH